MLAVRLRTSQRLMGFEEYAATPRTAGEVETYWELVGLLAPMGEPEARAILNRRRLAAAATL